LDKGSFERQLQLHKDLGSQFIVSLLDHFETPEGLFYIVTDRGTHTMFETVANHQFKKFDPR